VNSLASREFQHRFGKANVWQITPADSTDHHTRTVASHMRGRYCFLGGPQFREIESFVRRGAVMKVTLLTDVFTLEDFRMTHERVMILFQHDEEKGLRPVVSDVETIEGPTKIYSLVMEKEGA
ncbi:hypothetical protein N9090_00635, partial [bacterium]|nr:hypothetical protein [bacterium]